MTALIKIKNGVEGYAEVVNYVARVGTPRAPRGVSTREAGWLTVVMEDVTQSLPLGVGRRLNRSVAAAEAAQLIGAFSDPKLLTAASPNFRQFLETETQTFHGAYGQRIREQLEYVIAKLRRDSSTRQAVITLWDPGRDNQWHRLDYPCTVALNVAIIDGLLELNVVMRSQDVWLGAPYDWFQFTQFQQTCATLLGVQPGVYRHTTWSTHIYETDIHRVDQLHSQSSEREWQPSGLARAGDDAYDVIQRARAVQFFTRPGADDNERWYHANLASLVG